MINITLKQLKYFEALAHHGHFGHAAAACAISQPALSVQIKELEAELGQPLVERGPRQIRLTAFGEAFLARVTDILRQVDELGDFARSARGGMMERLRLGIIPTIAPYLLPRLIGHLSADFPGLDLNVRETLTPRLIQELHEGRIDAAILALPISEPALTEVPLFDESFVLVRPSGDAGHPVPDGETLARMRLLLLEEGHCFRDQALSFCRMGSAVPRDGLDGSSLTTLVQMVGVGLGVTLIPEMAVPVEARSAEVDIAHFSAPQPTRTIGMVWRRSSPLADQFQRIAEVVRRVGEQSR
ncbi:LysR substrate-binding domain-containing protein [Sagittula sp. S175]|uniref:hydrogen peroxide-inducible genes activator n=1 Tax=Sagittula sp. S175 TaxID=3415129 RepID=UPI003C7BF8C7